MQAHEVVTSDDQKLGTVIAERDDCVIIERGHVFKSKHAIPRAFLHEHDGVLRATVAKELVDNSPKVDPEHWDPELVRLHYGLDGPFEVDPDPNDRDNAEVEGLRHGVKPAPVERLEVQEGKTSPAVERPAVFERQANANDPAGTTSNLD